ncbi:unnamed protein product [Cuscuta europaea]|uniref:Uncharacterized protein n=1 Tax=Cuscuta europaea TaxID=41803 RepID=A0A9P1E207_CUSEU|nr:unnamed protein product [Cuscuta europaea]
MSPISWCTKKQVMVSRSSAEAEYRAMAALTCELIWLRSLLRSLGVIHTSPTRLYCDNQALEYVLISFINSKQVWFSTVKQGSENAIGYPCLSENTFAYLNKQDVQKAFHVKRTPLPYHWDTCHGPVKFKEDAYTTKNFHTLATLLKRHIPIMFYSGDQDASIPVVETRTFARMLVKHLKLDYLQKNRPWHNGLQVGGWRETFGKLREKNNVTYLTFASVKGGSHFVPTTSPSQALTL